ncbi:MAG TPA: DNA polymerase Y family protein [Rhizomicrobium sp.]|jgi:protein ImuB
MPSSARRILALWLPRFPTDRLTRLANGAPEKPKSDAPLVVAGRANNALFVYALNRSAERLGLHRGQPLANARAMIENLAVVPADEKADLTLLEAIADWCDRFTPLVTLDAPDGLFFDITGVAHLFGGEAAMLAHVRDKIAAQGFAIQAAIAGTSLGARALAHYAGGTITKAGEDRAAIAPLPITALDCGEDRLRALKRAGLKTIAQVAERGRSELAARLGAQFLTRLQVMLGAEEKPLSPRRPLPDLRSEMRFAEPVTTREIIESSLEKLAAALSDILEREGQGLRLLEAAFFRADGKVERISVKTGAPLRDPIVMLRLLKQRLDALADPLDPGFGFDLIRLEACLAEKSHARETSFDANENARWQTAFLVDRLSARFGEHRVQRFVAQDTHIPEAQAAAIPAQDRDFTGTWTRQRQDQDPPLRPLRMLTRPEEIHFVAASVPDGPPARFQWRQCRHDVVRAEGPERIGLEWWKEDPHQRLFPDSERLQRIKLKLLPDPVPPSRDYFRVETREGLRFWVYRDGQHLHNDLAARWYMHGFFA